MDERRIAERVVPKRKIKGRMQLKVDERWVTVRAVMDISPFGIRVRLDEDIRRSGDVQLRLECDGSPIETRGAIAWLVAGAGKACMAGISLMPENVEANTRLFEVIVGEG